MRRQSTALCRTAALGLAALSVWAGGGSTVMARGRGGYGGHYGGYGYGGHYGGYGYAGHYGGYYGPYGHGFYGPGFYRPYYGYGFGFGVGIYVPYYGGVAVPVGVPVAVATYPGTSNGSALTTGQPQTAEPQLAPDSCAHLQIFVPDNAEVLFDGNRSQQTGRTREFVSPKLEPGKFYTYKVAVRYVSAAGKPVDDQRDIHVRANDWFQIDFTQPAPKP